MHITAKWDASDSPETTVKFHRAFDNLSRIEKLDFLQDTIYEITEKYNHLIGIQEIA